LEFAIPIIAHYMCVRADSNYAYACTYYSGIMLVAEKHLLFQKFCQHIRHQAIVYTGQ